MEKTYYIGIDPGMSGGIAVLDETGNVADVLEIKCPNIGTFMKYKHLIHSAEDLKNVKPEYYWQMMAEMDCTGAVSGVFVTYCPWLSKPFHYANIERVEDDIKLMQERVNLANEFIDNIINK